jgi:hypothetical protein
VGVVKLDEGERQLLLMALAHLAVERPGWDDALNRLALKADDEAVSGRAAMYDEFRLRRRRVVVLERIELLESTK